MRKKRSPMHTDGKTIERKRDFIAHTLMAAFNCEINEIGNSLITIIAPDNIYDTSAKQWHQPTERTTHITSTRTHPSGTTIQFIPTNLFNRKINYFDSFHIACGIRLGMNGRRRRTEVEEKKRSK